MEKVGRRGVGLSGHKKKLPPTTKGPWRRRVDWGGTIETAIARDAASTGGLSTKKRDAK